MSQGSSRPWGHQGSVDDGTGEGDGGITTLAAAYNFGLANNPTVDNLLVGAGLTPYFRTYFRPDGGITIDGQTDSWLSSVPPWRVSRRRGEYYSTIAHWDSRFTTGTNTDGAIRHLFSLTSEPGLVERIFGTFDMEAKPNDQTGYSPGGIPAGDRSKAAWLMANRQGGGDFTRAEFNSDGGHFRECLFPAEGDAAAAQTFFATQLAMSPLTGSNPKVGSTMAFSITGPSGSFTDPYDMASWRCVLDDINVGVAQAVMHHEWWCRSTMGGAPARALQLFGPNSASLSSTDAAALSYDTITDKLKLSVNGGAYSPIATAADLPAAAITELTGDVLAGPGSGSVAAIIASIPADATREWTTDTAGGAQQNLATSLTMAGTNQDYEFEATINVNAAAVTWSIELNTLTTNFEAAYHGVAVDVSTGAQTDLNGGSQTATIAGGLESGSVLHLVRGKITQRTGFNRMVTLDVYAQAGTNDREVYTQQIRWNTTTEITGFRIHSSSATGIGTGSVLLCRKA